MNTVLFMHFPHAKDAHLNSKKYQNLALEYCRENGDNLVIILEANGADNEISQEAILQLIQEGLVDKVLIPNLLTIASDFKVAGRMVEKLNDLHIKIRFLDCMERCSGENPRTMESVC